MCRRLGCGSRSNVVALMVLLLSGSARADAPPQPSTRQANESTRTADVIRGKAVYEGSCIACHGADGTGSLPGVPDLTAPGGALTKSDAVLMDHVIDGFQGPGTPMAMPPKGGNPALTEQDVRDVLTYMRREFNVQAR